MDSLLAYGSDSDEDSAPSPHSKISSTLVQPKKVLGKRSSDSRPQSKAETAGDSANSLERYSKRIAHIPLPKSFTETKSAIFDDISQSDADHRNFAYGKWLSVVYATLQLPDNATTLHSAVYKIAGDNSLEYSILDTLYGQFIAEEKCPEIAAVKLHWVDATDLHISFSKMLPLAYHEINGFVERLRSVKPSLVDETHGLLPESELVVGSRLTLYSNEARTSLFLGIDLDENDEFGGTSYQWNWCQRMVGIIDNIIVATSGDDSQRFFKPSRFHVSVARVDLLSTTESDAYHDPILYRAVFGPATAVAQASSAAHSSGLFLPIATRYLPSDAHLTLRVQSLCAKCGSRIFDLGRTFAD